MDWIFGFLIFVGVLPSTVFQIDSNYLWLDVY